MWTYVYMILKSNPGIRGIFLLILARFVIRGVVSRRQCYFKEGDVCKHDLLATSKQTSPVIFTSVTLICNKQT